MRWGHWGHVHAVTWAAGSQRELLVVVHLVQVPFMSNPDTLNEVSGGCMCSGMGVPDVGAGLVVAVKQANI